MMHTKNNMSTATSTEGDAVSLRQLINHVCSNINAPQALSLNVPLHDLILNELMLVTLDAESQKDCELLIMSRTDTPTTAELITYLEGRCRALELIQKLQAVKTISTPHGSTHPTGNKVSKISHTYAATQVQCSLCNNSHGLFKCDKFLEMQPRQRLSYVKQSKLCFSCLQPFTKAHTCSKQMCQECHKRHHTLLHIDKQHQPKNYTGSTLNNPPADVRGATSTDFAMDEKGTPTEEVNSYCFMQANTKSHVLLATAIVEVMNKPGQFIPSSTAARRLTS
jgi:hypothetical protein